MQSNASDQYSLGENISQSGSNQGSTADSYGYTNSASNQSVYQDPYLQQLYGHASYLLNNYGMPNKQVADLNGMQQNGLASQYGFASGAGNDIYAMQLMSALGNMQGYGTAGTAADRMASGNAYATPYTNGMNYGTLAASVNNPFLQGQIDAASRDVVRNLNENQLTGNAAAAAASGNSASSRRAVMDAIAQRGAADRVADIGATMRGNAYNTGLGLANQTALANQQAALGTNSLNANLMSSGANLGYQLGQAGSTGLQSAYNTGVSNATNQQAAGNYLQQYQQQLLDTMYSNQMNPYTGLQLYQSLLGPTTTLTNSNSMGVNNSTSNSFGNSFNNGYSYNMGAGASAGSGTSTAKSFNLGANFGG